MRIVLGLSLLMIAGCSDTEEADESAGVDPGIDQWVATYAEQALRADRTKTHATGEHPVAKAEMDRSERALRDQCKTSAGKAAVRQAVDERIARYDNARQKAPPGGAMEDADFKMKAVRSLKAALGL